MLTISERIREGFGVFCKEFANRIDLFPKKLRAKFQSAALSCSRVFNRVYGVLLTTRFYSEKKWIYIFILYITQPKTPKDHKL